MRAPEEVAAMLRLHALGWGSRRIAAELGCCRDTVQRHLKAGGWRPYRRAERPGALAGLEGWMAERFRQHRGNADVLRQALEREHGLRVSLRTIERAVAHLRQELRAEALATLRFETAPGEQLQIDFGELRVPIGDEMVRVFLFVATLGYSRRIYVQPFRHERQSAWLDGLEGAFRHFGGVPAEVLFDNARALVQHHDAATREVVFNSTPRQVRANPESTRRQYQLAERARRMGWTASQIEVVDDDLGLSGASSQARLGFQRLVAAIGLGEVGIVLVTEISRLSRRNSDWHRVIELCAVFRTLIADEDGVYDAQDPNDLLLLGVKGTLFAAELHLLHARMRGNLLTKARRGELALRLPVGYRRLGDGTVVLEPDEQVRATLALLFERFALVRNARAVQRYFLEHGLAMPRLIQQREPRPAASRGSGPPTR